MVPRNLVGFLASPKSPSLSGIMSPKRHWSRSMLLQEHLAATCCIRGVFQAKEERGFSSVKKEPCACKSSQRCRVRQSISFPSRSRWRELSPSGCSWVRVPLFIFCMMLNEPQGKPKCHSCLGWHASGKACQIPYHPECHVKLLVFLLSLVQLEVSP